MLELGSILGDRFWTKVDRNGLIPEFRPDLGACWIWLGTRTTGYGRFYLDGKDPQAHRLTYEAFIGPIPEGLFIDHLCRVRACVNPAHLEPVTHAENVRRGLRGALYPSAGKQRLPGEHLWKNTHCRRGHPYSGDNLIITPRQRYCRTCRQASNRNAKRKRRQAARAA